MALTLTPSQALRKAARLTQEQRKAVLEKLQARFERESKALAQKLSHGGRLRTWQKQMDALIRKNSIQQFVIGAGRVPNADELRRLERLLKKQAKSLQGFADDLTIKRLSREKLNASAIANRATLYQGSGRASWYTGNEADWDDSTVIDYFAQDDKGTCEPCGSAASGSPYLPGQGPLPGNICEGGGRCRCTREARYAPRVAAGLKG